MLEERIRWHLLHSNSKLQLVQNNENYTMDICLGWWQAGSGNIHSECIEYKFNEANEKL